MAPRRIFNGAFFQGMAQALDLPGAMARRRPGRFRASRRSVGDALGSDWAAVGHDLSLALRRYRELHG